MSEETEAEIERRRGRPESDPDELANYRRRSVSVPEKGWGTAEKLAVTMNIRSRSGPHYGEYSWRSMILRLLMEDAPRIIEQIEALNYEPHPDDRFYFTLDLTRLPRAKPEGDTDDLPTDVLLHHSNNGNGHHNDADRSVLCLEPRHRPSRRRLKVASSQGADLMVE
jgi:hypothetical protein